MSRRGHRAHGQCGVRGAGRADGFLALLSAVAGRHHEQGAAGAAEFVDGEAHRVGAVAHLVRAQAHVDDLGALGGGPLHAVDDLRLGSVAVVPEDLADQQVGARCHPLAGAAGRGAGPADGGGDVGAVAEDVTGPGTAREVLRLADASGQVRMGLIDTGVEYRDLDGGAVVPGLPDRRGVDLSGAAVEGGVHPAVQPDLGVAATPAALTLFGGELLPEPAQAGCRRSGPPARRCCAACGRARRPRSAW